MCEGCKSETPVCLCFAIGRGWLRRCVSASRLQGLPRAGPHLEKRQRVDERDRGQVGDVHDKAAARVVTKLGHSPEGLEIVVFGGAPLERVDQRVARKAGLRAHGHRVVFLAFRVGRPAAGSLRGKVELVVAHVEAVRRAS